MVAYSNDVARLHSNILPFHMAHFICVRHTLKLDDHPFVAHVKDMHKGTLGIRKVGKIGGDSDKVCGESLDSKPSDFPLLFRLLASCSTSLKNCCIFHCKSKLSIPLIAYSDFSPHQDDNYLPILSQQAACPFLQCSHHEAMTFKDFLFLRINFFRLIYFSHYNNPFIFGIPLFFTHTH